MAKKLFIVLALIILLFSTFFYFNFLNVSQSLNQFINSFKSSNLTTSPFCKDFEYEVFDLIKHTSCGTILKIENGFVTIKLGSGNIVNLNYDGSGTLGVTSQKDFSREVDLNHITTFNNLSSFKPNDPVFLVYSMSVSNSRLKLIDVLIKVL